jgi:hypothetical protein
MEFDTKTIVLIGGALAVFFGPQVLAYIKQMAPKATQQESSSPKSRTVGSEPADWIVDLLHLKKVLDANGQTEASSLISQAATKIIGADTPRSNGGKR